jgi:hypothetical protein
MKPLIDIFLLETFILLSAKDPVTIDPSISSDIPEEPSFLGVVAPQCFPELVCRLRSLESFGK